jgi:hypothetical protein
MQVEQHQDGVRVPARLHGKGPWMIQEARSNSSSNTLWPQ